MKKIFILCGAVATMLCACNKETAIGPQAAIPDGEKVQLKIAAIGNGTRAAISADNEAKVNDLQVFVFRGEALDAYGHATNASNVTVSCTKGQRNVWAIVNAASLDTVSSLSSLKASVTKLADNSLTNFVMTGSKDVDITATTSEATVNVNRFASRVVIKKITNDLSSPALRTLTFTVDSIFMINVQGKNSYDSTAFQATDGVWHNKMGFTETEADMKALILETPAKVIEYGAAKGDATDRAFYVYPNDFSGTDANAGTWSKRATRIVVKASIGSDAYYYPITLPVLEGNKSYEINNLIITRPGSNDPDTPVTSLDVKFSINVVDWTTVLVTGSGDTAQSGNYTI